MELPNPYKGDTRGRKATQWLDQMLLWVALHQDQFNEEEQMVVWILYHMTNKAANWALPIIGTIIKGEGNLPNTIPALMAKFREAFANPNAKRAAARKIAMLTQTTTKSEYITKFCNLMVELDWNKEAYIAQFMHGLHWKVKELLSTKDNIPNKLEAIFAASIKVDNTCWENKENQPKKQSAKSLATVAISTTTRVCLLEDPNYVTPEERDCPGHGHMTSTSGCMLAQAQIWGVAGVIMGCQQRNNRALWLSGQAGSIPASSIFLCL
ncbi:Retrotransposon gag protein, partial [Rhizoctonia solani]